MCGITRWTRAGSSLTLCQAPRIKWPTHWRGDRPLPTPSRILRSGQFFAFGQGLQVTVGLPSMRQIEASLAAIGRLGPGCPYHPLLLCRPAADVDDRIGVVSVDHGVVLWHSGPAWVDLANRHGQQTRLLQHCWAPADGPLSVAQALEPGFKWRAGPETRRADADAATPLWMRCRCPGKVFVCCVVVECMSWTGCMVGWALGYGGVQLLHKQWDWEINAGCCIDGPRRSRAGQSGPK